ncbi:Hypothetical protein SMAX5B_006352 [Scophthalmus maximus]|uniref:Im:7138239 n=1 Tax=Scophthalmus maximus TaxID=52904 RepID=A0A2U9BIF9_SCOMX|nr:Hypothetical protein SMAX5B_006352 [Scophthalmus maximus]
MEVTWSFLVLLCALHLTLTGVLAKHIDHRNLFTQRMCCKRQSHFVYIGQDISGSPVSVDMGTCRSHCGGASRPPHETGQQDYSKYSSMLEFLRSKKDHSDMEEVCVKALKQHVWHNLSVTVIDIYTHIYIYIYMCVCVCINKCYFFVFWHKHHKVKDKPLSASEIICATFTRRRTKGFSCVPTKFDSALVETPNKVDLIQTVVTCELKESCYRVPYVEYYYEIVHHADGVKEERLKEIDVGRCLGGCTTGNRCLLRSPSNPELCHLWAERQSSSCVPQGYESQSFLNQHGLLRTVLSITSCLCQN